MTMIPRVHASGQPAARCGCTENAWRDAHPDCAPDRSAPQAFEPAARHERAL